MLCNGSSIRAEVQLLPQSTGAAAVDRRSRSVDAAGWLDWLTTPLLSKRRRAPFWLLAAVTATGTLAMHILIPVLPLAAADFSVSRRAIQQAITLFCLALPADNCSTVQFQTDLGGDRH
jgi:hypothetical protein